MYHHTDTLYRFNSLQALSMKIKKKKVKIEIFQSYWTHMQYVIWIYKVLKSCVFVGNLFYMWVQRIFTPSNSTEELIRGISRENGNDNTIV